METNFDTVILPDNALDEAVVDVEEDEELEELPIDINSCFLINKAYIESIDELKTYLISKSRENDSRQRELESNSDSNGVKDTSLNCGFSHPNSLIPFMAPYFKDMKGLTAPSNEDVLQKRKNGEINEAFISVGKPWNECERQKIVETLQMYAMERIQRPLRDDKEKLTKNKRLLNSEVLNKIKELDQKIDEIANKKPEDIEPVPRWDSSIDWLKLATVLDSEHTGDDCEIYWNNYLHTNINKSNWTKEEDEKLKSLVTLYGNRDWDTVALMLETGRVGWQCCARYQSEHNRDLKRVGPLTKAEAEVVEKVIESCRIGEYIPWHQVSYFVDGRTLPQIKHYWHKINVPKRGDVWTDAENKQLSAAVKRYGIHNWRKVAHFLPGRSNRQCRERYMMRLNITDRKLGNWTHSEDMKIIELAQEMNYRWVRIEEHIEGRNARQIASRYELLMKQKEMENSKKEQKKKSKKKTKTTRTLALRTRIYDKIRQIINRNKPDYQDLDQILRTGRAKLAQRLELETQGIDLPIKGRPKKTQTEENIDNKIVEMFALFGQKTTTKKPLDRSGEDQTVYDTTKQVIYDLLSANKPFSKSKFETAVRFLILNDLAQNYESNDRSNTNEHFKIPVFPPNRTTLRAFRSMLMHTDYLTRKIAESKTPLETYSASVPEDCDYSKISAQFKSLFCWPALLSMVSAPEIARPVKVKEEEVVNNGHSKRKRKSWLTTDSSRMVKIRKQQSKLIQTAMQSQEESQSPAEEVDEVPLDENSTKAPWYVTRKQRKYYQLKSLDKDSFVFTRVKPRPDSLQKLEPLSQTSNKRKSICDNSVDTDINSNSLPNCSTGYASDEVLIPKRIRTSRKRQKSIKGKESTVDSVGDSQLDNTESVKSEPELVKPRTRASSRIH